MSLGLPFPGIFQPGAPMYSTCLYCHKPLGSNQVIEEFPVGRRLAFDAARGRLWVICKACERWNLSPLDTRWEAIEKCEERFRATRLRVSTDNIGLARLAEGLELVRIGEPQRPEFAAWRYGDQFGRRRRRAYLMMGGITVAMGAVVVGASAAGIGFGGLWANFPQILNSLRSVKVRTSEGRILRVRGSQFGGISLTRDLSDDQPLLAFQAGGEQHRFRGSEALKLAGRLLPAINYSGGSKGTVAAAVRAIEDRRGPEEFLAEAIPRLDAGPDRYGARARPQPVSKLESPIRLALEMALHEEAERRAIEGELAALEGAWREAEEIAGIADNLFLPPIVEKQLEQLKQRTAGDSSK